MTELKIPEKHKNILQNFTQSLKDIYREDLISLVLYGSAASGEFADEHSNLNLLIVLKNTDLENLKKSSSLVRRSGMISPLFLTEDYISGSVDIFPIEFLDMQENYSVIYGKDILKGIHIDTRNLRFQCEQELKAKLLKLRHAYLMINNNTPALRKLLFVSFTSILHIVRNVLRLKGGKPAYLKQEVLRQLSAEFKIDLGVWEKILAAKNKRIKLDGKDVEPLFVDFVRELELMVDIIDKL